MLSNRLSKLFMVNIKHKQAQAYLKPMKGLARSEFNNIYVYAETSNP
jgi:hypothetical protein